MNNKLAVNFFTSGFVMMLMKIFETFSSYIWLLHHRSLYYEEYYLIKIIHNNGVIFYDEMVLICFMNTIAKPHVKR